MDLLDPPAPSDPLAEALHHLRMSGVFYCRTELTAPWGLTLPELSGYLWLHVVTSVALELDAGDERTEHLRSGDLALVTHGTGHVLRSAHDSATPGILELEREEGLGALRGAPPRRGGDRTTLVCGAVRFDDPAAHSLETALPALIKIEAQRARDIERLHATLSLIAAETMQPRPGGEAVITRLADILVIQAMRGWIDTDPDARTGMLGALRDPQIGRALVLIHADPARAWTVAQLAGEVGMSRSAFAARFTDMVREPAMQYVIRQRMQLAVNALRDDGATVAQLTGRLGYRSQAAFARAFKRVVGVAPGAVRRSAGDPIAARFRDR